MNYVIIGNGPTGVIAAETLRKADPAGKITMIGSEAEPPYSRMAIPYLLIGNIQEQGTHLRKGHNHFAHLKIDNVFGKVSKVDTAAKKVMLESGAQHSYDKLLIASGSHPVAPPIPGIDLPGIHPCWTLDDARKIMAVAKPGARVLQMGAGFIGCIIMESLAARGVKLTVVEMGDRMVPRMMTEGAGKMIKQWCEKKGVAVHTGTKVTSIEKSSDYPGALRANLSSGDKIVADLIISATGVKPNIDFLQGTAVKTAAGVLVNEKMQTNVADIYAAGDVAEAKDFSTDKTLVNAIQPNAADQARIAALNMAGKPATSRGSLAINVLDTLGLISSSFGRWWGAEGGQSVELKDNDNFKYMHLEFKDDVLVGATSVGLTQHVGVLRGLIQTQARLGPWKDVLLKDPTRVMEAYLARAQSAANIKKLST
ncbi:MAG: FAD-dependent oxidoreductase [Burkholderiales bacterium]